MTDRGFWLEANPAGLNMRRLMYQSLMWGGVGLGALRQVLRNDPRRLGPALNPEDLQRAADALVDGMRRNLELGGDFLGVEMLVDEAQAIELAGAQSRDSARNCRFVPNRIMRSRLPVTHQSSPNASHRPG
jgi:hypothetical protein